MTYISDVRNRPGILEFWTRDPATEKQKQIDAANGADAPYTTAPNRGT